MSENKNVTLDSLQTILPPILQLIETKNDWDNLKNRPFYTDSDGTVKTIDEKYLPIKGIKEGKGSYAEIFNLPYNVADGFFSHAEGYYTKTNSKSLNVIGEYNSEVDDKYIEKCSFVNTKIYSYQNTPDINSYSAIILQEIPKFNAFTGNFEVNELPANHVINLDDLKVGDLILTKAGYNSISRELSSYSKIIDVSGIDTDSYNKTFLNIVCEEHSSRPASWYRGKYIHIAGNGTDNANRSNAHTLDWDGNAWFSGDVYTGSTSGTNKDDGSKKLATEEYVNTKIDNFKNTPFIEGSGTTDSTAKTSTWIGSSDEITEYYDGLAIRYKIGVEGQSTVTLNINNLGEKTIYRFNTTKLTTQFPVGSIINLIYHTDLNEGCWMCNDYDANTNTQQRVYVSDTKNVEYPITARYATTTGASYYAEYGRYSTGVTLNPSKNTITATTFNGNLNGTATKATQDASGNIITDVYATKDYLQHYLMSNALTLTGIDAEGTSHTWTIYGVAQ